MEKQNNTIHLNLKFAGLVAKNSKNVKAYVVQLEEILRKKGISLLIEQESAKNFAMDGIRMSEILKRTNFIISLGGDGTLISVCRNLAFKDAFVLGIHAGTLGFLTDIRIDEFERFLNEFLNGDYDIERPYMLDVILKKKNKEFIKKVAFNDVVISRNCIACMAKIDAYLNEKYFNTYYGDGVIVSSPVGSTAYNMSANGPIIYPLCDVFCVTPICSHSLTQRSLILPKKYEVGFKNNDKSCVSIVIDGQDIFDMDDFESVSICMNKTKANLIRHVQRDYFSVLKEKLRWGHGG